MKLLKAIFNLFVLFFFFYIHEFGGYTKYKSINVDLGTYKQHLVQSSVPIDVMNDFNVLIGTVIFPYLLIK